MIKQLLIIFFVFFFSTKDSISQGSEYWTDASGLNIAESERQIVPQKYRTLALDLAELKNVLSTCEDEFTEKAKTNKVVIELPLPYGGMSKFYVFRSSIMEKPLADRFPQIQTFACQGIDDPYASARIDYTEKGFHAMVLSPNGSYFIDPYAKNTDAFYISYYKKDFFSKKTFEEGKILESPEYIKKQSEQKKQTQYASNSVGIANRSNGNQLRTYRIAIAATGEYSAFHGGTVSSVLSAQITTLNRVTAVYRAELSVSFNLIATNTSIIYLNASTDPYTNTNGSTMLGQNQTTLTNVIGAANYDIGHVFSTGGGGVAMLASVCSASTKAQGVTGSPTPVGDPFDIDYVAHEMGHQFGGNHTFNGNTGSCSGGNRNASTAYEPGSGSTIMAYAGICSPQDLQTNSDAYFHSINFDEIITNITTGSTGSTGCAVITSTGNTPPVALIASSAYTIPINTPFTLTGSATDANGDSLTYCWEQFDLGTSTAPNSPPNPGPRFRTYSPTISPSRTIPRYSNLLAGTVQTGEILPTSAQTAKFRLTARDNRSVGGGVDYDVNFCTVTFNAAGPFTINSVPSSPPNSTLNVTWNVNGTNVSPINCSLVNILLSTDGGLTFPTTLASNTSNDGIESISLPNLTTQTARIRIEAVGNIFFNISNVFAIDVVPPPTISSFSPTSAFPGDAISITGTNLGGVTSVSFGGTPATSFTINSNTSITAILGLGSSGLVELVSASGSASLAGFTLADTSNGIFKTVGTGTTSNNTTTYPAPYGNYYGGAKHQMIYTASELLAAGLSAGYISQFGFNVSALVAGPLNGLTLKIGTTTATTLSAFAASGLSSFYSTTAYNASLGWNMHQFSTPFYWNGTSNLIIETCFNNNNGGLTAGNTSTVQTTGLASGTSRFFRADNSTTVCASTSSTAATTRPNGRFFLTKVPTVNATSFTFSGVTNTGVTFSFVPGNGFKRIIVCRPSSAASVNPNLFVDYTANSTFGAGSSTGLNNFVVYNGDGNSVTVTGLTINTSYTFTVYEYNGAAGNNIYLLPGASANPMNTLPVTWLNFYGRRTPNGVVLNWQTASETNNKHFEIEKSEDNQTWKTIKIVSGAGNSNTIKTYQEADYFTNNNKDLFYKLKQVDFNGLYAFSKTIIIKNNVTDKISIEVKPNPNHGKFNVEFNGSLSPETTLKVFNSLGIEVWKFSPKMQEIECDLSFLEKGIYYIEVSDKNNSNMYKLFVQ